ncbi:unnamed protein product [Discula destructiva]
MLTRTLPRRGGPPTTLIARRFASKKSRPAAAAPPHRSKAATGTSPAATAAADAAATTPKVKLRRIVLTGAVALITVVGAITGARLKTDKKVVEQRKEALEMPLDEQIRMLEDRRAAIVAAKIPLERKLAGLRERMAKQRAAEAKREEGTA